MPLCVCVCVYVCVHACCLLCKVHTHAIIWVLKPRIMLLMAECLLLQSYCFAVLVGFFFVVVFCVCVCSRLCLVGFINVCLFVSFVLCCYC